MICLQFFWILFALFGVVLVSAHTPTNGRHLLADCANPNLMYNTMIVYGLDGTYKGTTADLILPNTADHPWFDRNTLEFRTAAYNFFATNYGLVFDPAIESSQTIMNGAVTVTPSAFAPDVPFHVKAFDDQSDSTPFQNRIQITNAFFQDAIHMATANRDVNLSVTTFGISDLKAGETLVYGAYRMVIDGVYDEEVMPDIQYNTEYGEKLLVGTNTILSCAVSHPLFGTGQTFGVSNMVNNDDGTWSVRSRQVMTFPTRLDDASTDGTGCEDLMVDDDDNDGDSDDSGSDSDDASQVFGALVGMSIASTDAVGLNEAADAGMFDVAVSLSKSSWLMIWAMFGTICIVNVLLCVWLRKPSKEVVDQHFADQNV